MHLMRWLERHAWWGLLLMGVVMVIFGVTDVVVGPAADRGIPLALTGMTLDELKADGPAAYRMFDFFTRVNGYSLALAGMLFIVVLVLAFRPGRRWAWWAMWLLPIWSVGVALFYAVAGLEPGQPPPPPMVSGPIVAVLAAGILAVTARRFLGSEGGA
jgi:hypothetical protein